MPYYYRCRAYTDLQEVYEDYYQEVCLQMEKQEQIKNSIEKIWAKGFLKEEDITTPGINNL